MVWTARQGHPAAAARHARGGRAPWYKCFSGGPLRHEQGEYDLYGSIAKQSPTTLVITELPVEHWTLASQEFLEEMLPADKKAADGASTRRSEGPRE